jgi:hypothetical protein
VPSIWAINDAFRRWRVVGDVMWVRRRRLVVELSEQLSFRAVGVGDQRASPELFYGDLSFRDFLFNVAELAVLEEDLDVELLRDGVTDGLEAFGSVLKLRVSERRYARLCRVRKSGVPGELFCDWAFRALSAAAAAAGVVWIPLSSTALVPPIWMSTPASARPGIASAGGVESLIFFEAGVLVVTGGNISFPRAVKACCPGWWWLKATAPQRVGELICWAGTAEGVSGKKAVAAIRSMM